MNRDSSCTEDDCWFGPKYFSCATYFNSTMLYWRYDLSLSPPCFLEWSLICLFRACVLMIRALKDVHCCVRIEKAKGTLLVQSCRSAGLYSVLGGDSPYISSSDRKRASHVGTESVLAMLDDYYTAVHETEKFQQVALLAGPQIWRGSLSCAWSKFSHSGVAAAFIVMREWRSCCETLWVSLARLQINSFACAYGLHGNVFVSCFCRICLCLNHFNRTGKFSQRSNAPRVPVFLF